MPAGRRRAAAQSATIRLGVLNDQSGTYRDDTGPLSAACVRQAVEEFARQRPDIKVEVLSADGQTVEMRDADDEVFRAAEELGIDLSHAEPSSVEEV